MDNSVENPWSCGFISTITQILVGFTQKKGAYPQIYKTYPQKLSVAVFDSLNNLRDLVIDVAPLAHLSADFLGRIHNRGVGAVAKVGPYSW